MTPQVQSVPASVPLLVEGRDALVKYLRRELVGPAGGEHEELDREPPHKRYTLGVLFPQDAAGEADDEVDETPDNLADLHSDDPVTLAGQYMPSSLGISFFFIGEPEVEVKAYAARYIIEKGSKGKWQRASIATEDDAEPLKLRCPSSKSGRTHEPVLNGAAEIHAHWRRLKAGFLVTITLVNNAKSVKSETRGEDCLCQVGFTCNLPAGEFQEYPSVDLLSADLEEQELQLLYRRNKVYAIGHGCSAEWHTDSGPPASLKTQVMPTAYVAAMTHDLEQSPEILKVARLAFDTVPKTTIIKELKTFAKLYADWIDKLNDAHPDIPAYLSPAKGRLTSRLTEALARMQLGIEYLDKNPIAWQAFQLANRAMLMQMLHGTKELAGIRSKRNEAHTSAQDYASLPYKWRPFQLAFQLLTIESVANEQSNARDTVDLIWFPTGGGKTEAYLAVAAFEIFRRRLVHQDHGAGTAVITRYTLRLLTSQQFQRAARLICACEMLRRESPDKLGRLPITIGLWAGLSASPNKYQQSCRAMEELLEHDYPAENNPFQVPSFYRQEEQNRLAITGFIVIMHPFAYSAPPIPARFTIVYPSLLSMRTCILTRPPS
jgi:hypothetical protein